MSCNSPSSISPNCPMGPRLGIVPWDTCGTPRQMGRLGQLGHLGPIVAARYAVSSLVSVTAFGCWTAGRGDGSAQRTAQSKEGRDMTAQTIFGIDPGACGTIAVLNESGDLLDALGTPPTPEANGRTGGSTQSHKGSGGTE